MEPVNYNPMNISRSQDPSEMCDHTCRMRDCVCRNRGEGWYTGKCEFCAIPIYDKTMACRIPRNHGGWSGCYCSWDCAQKMNKTCRGNNVEERDWAIVICRKENAALIRIYLSQLNSKK